ncbi:MAG: hypothetical protein LQ350_007885 [Teloschistes chrysophthalmus]|nr:MAG: hypothetical protein LQ350_007885 [Niorma chrysophthalma]
MDISNAPRIVQRWGGRVQANNHERERLAAQQRDADLQRRISEAYNTQLGESTLNPDYAPMIQPLQTGRQNTSSTVNRSELDASPRSQAPQTPPTPRRSVTRSQSPPSPLASAIASPNALLAQISHQTLRISELETELRTKKDEVTSLRAEREQVEELRLDAINGRRSDEEVHALKKQVERLQELIKETTATTRGLEVKLDGANEELSGMRRRLRQAEAERREVEDRLIRERDQASTREAARRDFLDPSVREPERASATEHGFERISPTPTRAELPDSNIASSNRVENAESESRASTRRSIRGQRGPYISVPRGQRHAGSTFNILLGL